MLRFLQFFTLRVQLITFVVSTVLFIVLTITSGFAWSWFFLLIMLVLIVKYLILGTVNAAAMEMQMGDLERAERTLNYTRFPKMLQFKYHGVYYFLKGTMAMQRGDWKDSEAHIQHALDLTLPADEMTAVAYLNMASIQARRRRKKEAQEYIQKAKKLKVQEPTLQAQIQQVEDALNGRGAQQRNTRNMRPGRRSNSPQGGSWF